ncbi:DNA polymerase-3 subunit epsilon [Rhizobium sp. BK313]|uniref:3'-5' exonuclease n=1 Tax=Rhizobium sp. BK313 TaxID=2587081 RepID=UPI001608C5E8|nr:3'-5' exonuclease [Rhizobium sp. BK313]MBB3453934.1 DNA polymerase-3 subunit epsilon [Rhizobium sp. BK313]
MILFFDTETTGFFQDRLPVDHPDQPYIVQLAAELCEDDGKPISGFSFIIDNGVDIPAQASNVHGITTERAAQFGMSAVSALSAFTHLYQRADLVCAHNIKFDRGVIETAIARHYERIMPLRKPLFCTMEAATPIVNLPPTERMLAAGFNKPKAPKLEECVRHFFNEGLDGAHDAMVDVVGCRRVYFHLKTLEMAA